MNSKLPPLNTVQHWPEIHRSYIFPYEGGQCAMMIQLRVMKCNAK